jgi:hypothetical protein
MFYSWASCSLFQKTISDTELEICVFLTANYFLTGLILAGKAIA